MARACGAPAYFYGGEHQRGSHSQLYRARTAQAAAIATDTAGQNLDVVLYAADGATGCADPAFDAHVNVIKSWALAWWEGWFPAAAMARSHRAARAKICSAKGSIWRLVTGPAAATIAILKRLGWATLEPAKTVDDLGFA